MAELARMTRVLRSGPARRAAPHQRYMAFLSYSHHDEATADWLHQTLEQYKVPPRLVGQLTEMGAIPRRLTPIFRDRHELAAAGNLGEEIEEAINGSRFLIVLCSPAASKSRWINEEVICFKRLHGEDNILAAIIEGEPFASDIAGREAEECFPPALRVGLDRRGKPTERRAEPMAADFREHGDGKRIGLLKIVAGMLGVGLDALAQREAHRRQRRLTLITAASVVGMLAASGLSYTAIQSRDEARDQRREAEGLIGFMLGDLRQKLEPVGRLDVLDAVGVRALAYFEMQDKASLSDAALAQRSKALTLMGEIAASRGDLDGALRRYREALAGTQEALRRAPDDPQRLFDHAQSVYWVGSVAMLRGRTDEAAGRFREYRQLAQRMIATDPSNPKWQLESIYAASNLGIVELEQFRYNDAVSTFLASVNATDRLLEADPGNIDYRKLLLEALAYLSDAQDSAGKLDLAIVARQRQLALLAPLLAKDRPDADLRQKAMIAHMALSRLLFEHGESEEGLSQAGTATKLGQELVELEPTNADWAGRSANTQLNLALLALRTGDLVRANKAAATGCSQIDRLVARDPSVVYWRGNSQQCLGLRAELAVASGADPEANFLARQMLDAVRADQRTLKRDPFAMARSQKVVGDMLWRSGDRIGAAREWRSALALWPRALAETPAQLAQRGEMLRGIGSAEGHAIASRLAAMGYRQSISNRAKL